MKWKRFSGPIDCRSLKRQRACSVKGCFLFKSWSAWSVRQEFYLCEVHFTVHSHRVNNSKILSGITTKAMSCVWSGPQNSKFVVSSASLIPSINVLLYSLLNPKSPTPPPSYLYPFYHCRLLVKHNVIINSPTIFQN